jgi:hypothetical protein
VINIIMWIRDMGCYNSGQKDLRGSGRRSVISYVHGEDCCITVYGVVQALSSTYVKLKLREFV